MNIEALSGLNRYVYRGFEISWTPLGPETLMAG